MGLKFSSTGSSSSAAGFGDFAAGGNEAPLRLIMGQTLTGSTQRVEPVGNYLDNSPDEPRVLVSRALKMVC